jgi:hypothetical protein
MMAASPAAPAPDFVEPAVGQSSVSAVTTATPSPTPAVVAVVGAAAADADQAATAPAASGDEGFDMLAYAGFGGLVLLLLALTLVVYRRRLDMAKVEQR